MSTLGPYINGNKFFDKFASIGGVMNGSNIHIATTNTTTDLQKQGLRQKKVVCTNYFTFCQIQRP